MLFRSVVVFMVVAASVAAQPSKEELQKERDKLKGIWRVTTFEVNGKEIDPDIIKRFEWIFENDKVTVKANAQERESTYVIDPTKKLRTIDLTWKNKSTVGIYEFTAADRMRICLAKEGEKKRPPDFVSKERSDWTLITLRRQKQ